MNSYPKGATVKFACTFKVADVLTDPGAITLKIKDPAATITTYTFALGTVTRAALGSYSKILALATAGRWHYRWEGTAAAAGVEENALNVETGAFG